MKLLNELDWLTRDDPFVEGCVRFALACGAALFLLPPMIAVYAIAAWLYEALS